MNKIKIKVLLILIIVVLSGVAMADGFDNENKIVSVIPVKGMINNSTSAFVNESINDSIKNDVDLLVFNIDTYGGKVVDAIDIKDRIFACPIKTVGYVNSKALSAGTLIAIACEDVAVSAQAVIGAAEVIPNVEKNMSMWRTVLKGTAESRNRNGDLVIAMADSDYNYEGLSEPGKLLTLTSTQSLDQKLADFSADSVADIVQHYNLTGAKVREYKENFTQRVAKILSNPIVSGTLLILGFALAVIEIFVPGFGLPGILSICCFLMFFAANIMVGNSAWYSALLFIGGIMLLIIEVIVPGFGLPGISGIILVSTAVIMAMGSLQTALITFSVAMIGVVILVIVLIKLGYKSVLFKRVVLHKKAETKSGYVSFEISQDLIDKKGVALTELRPVGFILINEEKYDAISDQGWIKKDKKIYVSRIEGSKVYVKEES